MSKLTEVGIPKIPHLDKWVHGVVYAIFSFLLVYGWKISRPALTLSNYTSAILVASCYGGVMEILQFFSKDRSFEWWDIAANLAGAFLGTAIYFVWNRHNNVRPSPNTNPEN